MNTEFNNLLHAASPAFKLITVDSFVHYGWCNGVKVFGGCRSVETGGGEGGRILLYLYG